LITMSLGHSAFLIWHRLIKKSQPGGRKPYFPFILVGYLCGVFLYFTLLIITLI